MAKQMPVGKTLPTLPPLEPSDCSPANTKLLELHLYEETQRFVVTLVATAVGVDWMPLSRLQEEIVKHQGWNIGLKTKFRSFFKRLVKQECLEERGPTRRLEYRITPYAAIKYLHWSREEVDQLWPEQKSNSPQSSEQ